MVSMIHAALFKRYLQFMSDLVALQRRAGAVGGFSSAMKDSEVRTEPDRRGDDDARIYIRELYELVEAAGNSLKHDLQQIEEAFFGNPAESVPSYKEQDGRDADGGSRPRRRARMKP